jgi:hypothetical protein
LIADLPKQNQLLKDKDEEWRKQSVEALVNKTSFDSQTYDNIIKYYDAANGALHEEDYRYVTNPYKTSSKSDGSQKQFPARMRNYDILGNVVGILMGERRKRPFNHSVITTNEDTISRYKTAEKEFADEQVKQILINELERHGLDTGGEKSKEMDDLQSIMEKFKKEWKDDRAIQGQHAINYLKQKEEIFDKTQIGWGDLIKSGRVFSYRGIGNSEPEYSIIPPWDLDFGGSENVRFVEDCDWVVCRSRMTTPQILENFWREIEEEDNVSINDLNKEEGNTIASSLQTPSIVSNNLEDELGDEAEHLVYHVVWKSMKKIGILVYQDELGQEEKIEVSEEFTPRKDDDITWYWVNEVWEGYRIDDKFFIGIQPLPIQREAVNNKSDCKLPYNGILAVDRGSQNISLVQKGYPYQVLYNIYHYRLEWGIAKNKGKIAMMDISLFPDRDGWEIEDSFYFMDTMNMLLFDGAKAGANQSVMQALKDIDLSFHEFISSHVELINQIRSEWEEMAGISRQRKGDVSPYAGKGATEQAVYNSATITEEMFAHFDSFVQRDLTALLDYSKVSWIDGKKINYMGEDAIPAMFELDPIEHMESEYGIYLSNSSSDNQKFTMLQDVIPTFAQNQTSPNLIAEMIDADNFPTLKRKLAAADEEMEKQRKAAQKQEMKQKQMEQKDKQMQREHEAKQNELDRESKEYQTQIQVKADIYKQDKSDERADINEMNKQIDEREKEQEEQAQEREKYMMENNQEREKRRIEREENQIEREKMANDLKIEKIKLDNPTPGENLDKTQQQRQERKNKND